MKKKRLVIIAGLLCSPPPHRSGPAAADRQLGPASGASVLPGGAALPILGQPPQSGGAELPITRIVLFTSGVGYFQREGQVDGNAQASIYASTPRTSTTC